MRLDHPSIAVRVLLISGAFVATCAVPMVRANAAQPTAICGDLDGSGTIAASDALFLLKRAVGQQVTISCPACPSLSFNTGASSQPDSFTQSQLCGDLDGSGSIAASDALVLLKRAVGQNVQISCPVCSSTTTLGGTTTTTIVAAEGCGNGVRDGAEQCEGLDGCAETNAARLFARAKPSSSRRRTSQDLIAQALARGDIDYPTSLLYRVWALFLAPELPEAYDGVGSRGRTRIW